MGVLRLLFIGIVLCYASTFLFPEGVASEIYSTIQDVTSLASTKAGDLDKKHSLVERSTAAITESRAKVTAAVKNPSSHGGKRVLGAGIASFLLGFQLGGGFYLGLALAFGSTLVDLQQGLAGDIAHAVEEVALLAWSRIKAISRKCFS